MSTQKPTVALIMALVGGLLVVGFGLIALPYMGGIGFFFGILGICSGVVEITIVVKLNGNLANHRMWGALIIALSVLSLILSNGGFFVGFLLGVLGGALLVIWRPRPKLQS